MRRRGGWAVGAVVLLTGVSAGWTHADDGNAAQAPANSSANSGSNWNPFRGWFAPSSKGAQAPADGRSDSSSAKPKELADSEKAAAENEAKRKTIESAGAKALQNYLRRLEVCDRLMQVAIDTNDKELERRAKELEERATMALEQQRLLLPVARAGFESDRQSLQKHLPLGGKDDSLSSSLNTYPSASSSDRAALEERR